MLYSSSLLTAISSYFFSPYCCQLILHHELEPKLLGWIPPSKKQHNKGSPFWVNDNRASKKIKYVPGRKSNIVIYLLIIVHLFRDLSETYIYYLQYYSRGFNSTLVFIWCLQLLCVVTLQIPGKQVCFPVSVASCTPTLTLCYMTKTTESGGQHCE